MIRTIITPQNSQITLNLPKDLVGKKLEVLVFSQNETKTFINIEENKDKIDTHFASEKLLAKDWLNEKEDLIRKDL